MGYIPKPDNISQDIWEAHWIEWNRIFKLNYAHEKDFIAKRGYISLFIPHRLRGKHPAYHDCNEYRPGKFKASNGITYDTKDEFYEGYGCVPCYEKNGICYGWAELLKKENYKEPFEYPHLDY